MCRGNIPCTGLHFGVSGSGSGEQVRYVITSICNSLFVTVSLQVGAVCGDSLGARKGDRAAVLSGTCLFQTAGTPAPLRHFFSFLLAAA